MVRGYNIATCSLLLTLPSLLPTTMIWTLADDRTVALIACSEQVITVSLKSAVVVSVDILDISGRDLEIFNTVERTDSGADVILMPSIWNALV